MARPKDEEERPNEKIQKDSSSGDEVLGRLPDASTPPQQTPPPAPEQPQDPLGGLLGSLMGGAPSQGAGGGDPLGGLLGALMGGQAPNQQSPNNAPPTGQPPSSDPLGGLLGALLGGGAPQTPGNMPSPNAAADSPFAALIDPLADSIANRFGMPRDLARVVVMFAVTKLVASMTGRAQPGRGSTLFNRVQSGQGVDRQYLVKSGLAGELAQQSGMDEQKAATTLQQVLGGLAQNLGNQ